MKKDRLGRRLVRALTAGTLGGLLLSACADVTPLDVAPDGEASLAQRMPPGLADRGPLERVQFVHYPRAFARPPWAGGGGGGGGETASTCYAFIANGARWTSPEPWQVYNGSDDGVTAADLLDRVGQSLVDWEGAARLDIAGSGGSGTTDVNLSTIDGFNVVKFGNVSNSGAIAVTNVWGYFRGPTATRQIVEWDMILDDTDFSWSTAGEAGKMDVWNIVSHEVGHALGMGHPESTCTEETMYAYAGVGEIKKRTLNPGDQAGIAELY